MVNKDKGFRDGQLDKTLEGLRKTATKEELQRIQEVREFGALVPDSYAYKIAVHLDSINQTLLKYKLDIEKTLWSINNTQNAINRGNAQLKIKKITEKLKDDLVMNEDELRAHIEYMKWTQLVELNQIPRVLGEIRMMTGHKNLLGEVIINNEQFEEYVEEIKLRVTKLGFDLL